VVRLEVGRERAQPVLPAGDQDEVVAAGREPAGELRADAGGRAGDDGERAVVGGDGGLPGCGAGDWVDRPRSDYGTRPAATGRGRDQP
jgi:hypothetical protein